MKTISKFAIVSLLAVSLIACKDNKKEQTTATETVPVTSIKAIGYLYTTTNGEGTNQVVQLARYGDGTVGNEKVYSTGDKGGSNHAAPAHGDYDAQGSLKIVGDYLLTTNTGGNSVSVFKINKQSGDLTFVDNTPADGRRPVTIDFTPADDDKKEYWVVIGNQWDTPTVLYEGDKLQRFPSDEWLAEDLTKKHESDKDRSIELFKLNMANGELIFVKTLAEYVRENGGPADVKFSPDGKKLAVTLWGIPHFFVEDPILEETKPSRVYVYDFENGAISNPRYFEEPGLIGAVGFHWHNNSEILYVSYFNLITAKDDNGLVVLKDSQGKVSKFSNHKTGGDALDEACWTAISKDQKRLYVCSYITNVVTPFNLNEGGTIAETLPIEKRKDYEPEEDSKDLYISPDNKFLYMLGSFFSYSVNTFEITDEGVTYKHQYTLEETKDEVGNPGVYDLVGLDGFDL